MFAATLLTAPDTRIEPALVEGLRNAWGGGPIRALGPDAAEFEMPRVPGNAEAVWTEMQARGVDLLVQPPEGREKRMLLADMDSTMIAQECIDELAAEAGIGAEVAAITARAMNGELDFEQALTARVGLLADLPEDTIARVLDTRITLMSGGPVLLATMKARGAHAALVSGGFTAFTAAVAGRLGFDEHRANTLLVRDGRLSGQVALPILGRAAKLEALQEITARLGLAPADVLAVGDGMNDLSMLDAAGAGVALHGKPALQAECALRVNHGDLTALLYLQGIARADWAADPTAA